MQPAMMINTAGRMKNIEIEIMPPTADTNNKIPPSFAFFFTMTDETMARIEKSIAAQPNPVISLVPESLNAASIPPKARANIAPKIQKYLQLNLKQIQLFFHDTFLRYVNKNYWYLRTNTILLIGILFIKLIVLLKKQENP